MPTVSVVMPVYNTPISYLREATESILQQTYTDFEFIIVDDHSNEETVGYLSSLTDARIRILRNSENLGITKSLNKGFAVASGKYIARMDADDISVPTRLEKQVRFMEDNPDVIVCGTAVRFFSETGDKNLYRPQIDNMEEFRIRLLFENRGPIHPSVMYRSSMLEKYHISYDERFPFAQDYAMWVTCSKNGSIRIIDEVLLFYREHKKQVSITGLTVQDNCATRIREKQLKKLIGPVSEQQKEIHEKCHRWELSSSESWKWLRYLEKQNLKTGVYDPKLFNKVITERQYKQKLAWYTRAREENGMPFLPAFLLYAPLKYKISKCCSVFATAVKRISVRTF